MLEGVRRWFATASTVFKLIFSTLGLVLIAGLALVVTRKRGQTADARRTSFRSESQAEVKVEEFKAGHARLAAKEHIEEAARSEALLPSIDANLQAIRSRIAALRKELNG